MRTAHSATVAVVVVAVLVTLSVSRCAGRPWQQQQRQRQRPERPAAYEPSTAAATYAEYDGDPSAGRREPLEPDYGESELVYAEPERVYAEPERVYAEPERVYAEPERVYAEPEQNYEVDEAASVLSDGRVHGVQPQQAMSTTTTTTTTTDHTGFTTVGSIADSTAGSTAAGSSSTAETRKSGYVVDGKHYRKYRVEEETADGFIVGEYGVVSHHDGTTRGVRYTADSSINPRVIYEALAKFLALR